MTNEAENEQVPPQNQIASVAPRVAIVGGGLSGLSTAVHLHQSDPTLRLSLFEANADVGGVIQTERIGSFLVDHGGRYVCHEPQCGV